MKVQTHVKSIDESSGNSYTWRGPADVLIPERSEAFDVPAEVL